MFEFAFVCDFPIRLLTNDICFCNVSVFGGYLRGGFVAFCVLLKFSPLTVDE